MFFLKFDSFFDDGLVVMDESAPFVDIFENFWQTPLRLMNVLLLYKMVT